MNITPIKKTQVDTDYSVETALESSRESKCPPTGLVKSIKVHLNSERLVLLNLRKEVNTVVSPQHIIAVCRVWFHLCEKTTYAIVKSLRI